ncbi:MAG: hypothetical protein JWM18_2597 [Chloroflexi bacterium]|nr:hypothetical protein [Chloroflexota bacterium]
MGGRGGRRRAEVAAVALAGWAVLLGLWLLLVDNFDPPELMAGSAAALIAAVSGGLACRSYVVLRPSRISPADAWRLPLQVVHDTVVVLHATLLHVLGVRRLDGGFGVLPAGSEAGDPGAAGRRAAVLLRTSLAPNTVALGYDPRRGEIVVHHLVRPR